MTTTQTTMAAIEAGQRIYKQFQAQVEPLEARRIRFTITTGDPDRQRDVVDPRGVEFDAYLQNPVVMFAHDLRTLPIARTVRLERRGNGLVAEAEFVVAGLNVMAEQVFQMVKAGFLRGASIGFRPLEWTYNETRKGIDFTRVELLEWSVVPVPANAQTLLAASAAGIDTSLMKAWAETTLVALREAPGDDAVMVVLADEVGADADPLITVRQSELAATIRQSVAPLVEQARALAARLSPPEPDGFDVDAGELDEIIADALRAELSEVVRRETRRAINELRGRVDDD